MVILDLVVSGFEQSEYTVSEEDGSVTVCTNLVSPVIERDAIVTFRTVAIPMANSAIRKQIFNQFCNS